MFAISVCSPDFLYSQLYYILGHSKMKPSVSFIILLFRVSTLTEICSFCLLSALGRSGLCFVMSAVVLPHCVGVVNQPVSHMHTCSWSTGNHIPAPQMSVQLTCLQYKSPSSSSLLSQVAEPRAGCLTDQHDKGHLCTCDSPAPSKNVWSSLCLHSSQMNLHKSAVSVSF